MFTKFKLAQFLSSRHGKESLLARAVELRLNKLEYQGHVFRARVTGDLIEERVDDQPESTLGGGVRGHVACVRGLADQR